MSMPRRPVPQDFAERVSSLSVQDLREHYRISWETLRRWLTEAGIERKRKRKDPLPKRGVPVDFAQHIWESQRQLQKRYAVSGRTLTRWLAEVGVAPQQRCMLVPSEFAELAPTMTRAELAVRFCRSVERIDAWCKIVGVKAMLAPRGPKRFTTSSAARNFNPLNHTPRDMSALGQAVEYLRRFGPVYRCTATGRAWANGTHWSRRGHVLTDAEIIERAEWNRSREDRRAA